MDEPVQSTAADLTTRTTIPTLPLQPHLLASSLISLITDQSLLVDVEGLTTHSNHYKMSLSNHLVDTYERKPVIPPRPPSRPSYPPNPSLATPFGDRTLDADSSWMSGHGGFAGSSTTMSGFSRWSEERIASLQVRLARKLGPEYVTQRPGPGGGPKLR